jgi:hypothetical protein
VEELRDSGVLKPHEDAYGRLMRDHERGLPLPGPGPRYGVVLEKSE